MNLLRYFFYLNSFPYLNTIGIWQFSINMNTQKCMRRLVWQEGLDSEVLDQLSSRTWPHMVEGEN